MNFVFLKNKIINLSHLALIEHNPALKEAILWFHSLSPEANIEISGEDYDKLFAVIEQFRVEHES